jgi:hypothetical protein
MLGIPVNARFVTACSGSGAPTCFGGDNTSSSAANAADKADRTTTKAAMHFIFAQSSPVSNRRFH